MKKRRFSNEVNAGSMADIAFLLLIFFLVTTTIETEKGIKVKLPRWDKEQIKDQFPDRNVLSVHINADNKIMVEKKEIEIEALKEIAKSFITNPEKSNDKPSSPKNALVAFQNDRETSYAIYIKVYNELKAAYDELWDAEAKKLYTKPFATLSKDQKLEVKKIIPLVISESEPTSFKH